MQPKRNIDWQIRKLLRRHPVPSHQLKEELWKGIDAALDARQPVRKTNWMRAGIAALLLVGSASGVYFFSDSPERLTDTETVHVQKETHASASTDLPKQVTESLPQDPGTRTVKPVDKYTAANSGSDFPIGRQLADIQSEPVIYPVEKDIEFEKPEEIKNTLAALSLRLQDLRVTSSTSPLAPQKMKHRKRNRLPAARNGSTWTSLFLNIWDNPAYTGASGRLALSYDDNMSFFDYWRSGLYRDYFAIDGRIPKTPFSIGVYHDRAVNAFSMKTGTAFTTSARVLAIGGGDLSIGMGVSRLSKRFFRTGKVHYSEPPEMTFGLNEVTKKRTFTTLQTALSMEAGAWYQAKHIVAGISVKNANEPLFGYSEQAEPLHRNWHFTGGYRAVLGKFQILPMVQVERNKLYSQASASVIATFDDRISIGGSIQNINPVTRRGDKMAYAGAKVFNSVTIFSSYGLNGEMVAKGLSKHIFHTGLRVQLPR